MTRRRLRVAFISASLNARFFERMITRSKTPLEVARDRNYLAASDMHAVQRMVHGAPSGGVQVVQKKLQHLEKR